jgi:hypothetical protein
VPGLLMVVGNVGDHLAPYADSDTFLSRDAGFTWEEVHKDAHLWEFGDSGSILVMANDEEATDHVMYSLDEGKTWREYKFDTEKMRVRVIVTVPEDTSRRFILLGYRPRDSAKAVAIHLDFSALTRRQCTSGLDWCRHCGSLRTLTKVCWTSKTLQTTTLSSGVLPKSGVKLACLADG